MTGNSIANAITVDETTGEILPAGDTAEYWAGVINADVSEGVQRFILAGQHLIEAKQALSHGEWGRMMGRGSPDNKGLLAFHYNTAARLMNIAQDRRLSNVAHAPHLPPSWYTLYELTKLTDERKG